MAKAITFGCPKCQGKKFTSNIEILNAKRKDMIKTNKSKIRPPEGEVSIEMHGKGKYGLNVYSLLMSDLDNTPLVVKDTKGKVNFVYDTES